MCPRLVRRPPVRNLEEAIARHRFPGTTVGEGSVRPFRVANPTAGRREEFITRSAVGPLPRDGIASVCLMPITGLEAGLAISFGTPSRTETMTRKATGAPREEENIPPIRSSII